MEYYSYKRSKGGEVLKLLSTALYSGDWGCGCLGVSWRLWETARGGQDGDASGRWQTWGKLDDTVDETDKLLARIYKACEKKVLKKQRSRKQVGYSTRDRISNLG